MRERLLGGPDQLSAEITESVAKSLIDSGIRDLTGASPEFSFMIDVEKSGQSIIVEKQGTRTEPTTNYWTRYAYKQKKKTSFGRLYF